MVEVFAALVVVEGHRMIIDCGCLQRTMAAGVAWQPSVRHGTASEDGACGIGIVGRLGWQRTAAGCLAWLGYLVRYIVERWRNRLLRLADMAPETMCAGEARK